MDDVTRAAIAERFWANVEPFTALDSCWEWKGYRTRKGYGQWNFPAAVTPPNPTWGVRAHRIAYEFLIGPIPDGLQLDHLCSNRACVNPDHLEPVTSQENTRRGNSNRWRRRRDALAGEQAA